MITQKRKIWAVTIYRRTFFRVEPEPLGVINLPKDAKMERILECGHDLADKCEYSRDDYDYLRVQPAEEVDWAAHDEGIEFDYEAGVKCEYDEGTEFAHRNK